MRLATVCFALAACSHAPAPTGAEIAATYESALDQLLISGFLDGEAAFAPGVLPDAPRPLQPEGETGIVYLPAALIGKSIVLRVDGLHSGQITATGSATFTVIGKRIERIAIGLAAPVVCGDAVIDPLLEECDDGNRNSGDGCSADCVVEVGYSCHGTPSVCLPRCGGGPPCASGLHCQSDVCVCDATSCPSGCCNGSVCMDGNTPEACGSAGHACGACPTDETCTSGVCSGCAQSCSGCCEGSTCTASSFAACGAPGDRCLACDTTQSDSCNAGVCTCGTHAACNAGETCAKGNCTCDASCDGCCDGGGCEARSPATCGAAADTCSACDTTRADTCAADGTCACGSSPECALGETCNNHVCLCGIVACGVGLHCGGIGKMCVCDASSCSGCCAGPGACLSLAAENANQCGSGGQLCIKCTSGGHPTCNAGACQ